MKLLLSLVALGSSLLVGCGAAVQTSVPDTQEVSAAVAPSGISYGVVGRLALEEAMEHFGASKITSLQLSASSSTITFDTSDGPIKAIADNDWHPHTAIEGIRKMCDDGEFTCSDISEIGRGYLFTVENDAVHSAFRIYASGLEEGVTVVLVHRADKTFEVVSEHLRHPNAFFQ